MKNGVKDVEYQWNNWNWSLVRFRRAWKVQQHVRIFLRIFAFDRFRNSRIFIFADLRTLNGTNLELFKVSFSTFEPKCTERDLLKSHICPILGQSDIIWMANLTSLVVRFKYLTSDSSHLTLRKIDIWMSKKCQKLSYFSKNCHWQFFGKIWQILAFFFIEKCQFFGNVLTFYCNK